MRNIYDFTEKELDTTIKQLNLSSRATSRLILHDILTLRDLLDAIENIGLSKFYGMGKKSIDEIMNKIAQMQTAKYRNINTKLEKIEQKDKAAEKKIAKYSELIEKLTQARQKYQSQIAILRNYNEKQ